MTDHLRAFVAVLVLTVIALAVTRWMIKGTSLYEPFERRRNYWVMVTLVTFLVPNFWLAMALLGAIYFWAARKDPNPVGIYLMFLVAVPPVLREIAGFGPITYFFALNNARVLSIAVLLPLAVQMFTMVKPKGPPVSLAPRLTDVAAILMAIYLVLIYLPHESITNLMRRTVHVGLDFLLPYFVISRWCKSREQVIDALGALLVAALILSQLAIFEHFKGWLLFGGSAAWWGAPDLFGSLYLFRDTSLRASVTLGHALVLGHLLVVCFGLLGLFRVQFTRWRMVAAWAILILAMYSTVSRGPWLAGALVILMLGLFTRRVMRFYGTLFGVTTVGIVALMFTPWDQKIINFLPFIGQVDLANVEYRQQILDTTFLLIRQNPLFGNVNVMDQLEHLRQGQGIIDIVNVYAEIAMTFGLIGLFLFVLFLASGLFHALLTCWRMRRKDREIFAIAGNTAAALTGSMITLAGIANYLSVPLVYTSLVALMISAVRLSRQPAAQNATVARDRPTAITVRAGAA